MNVLHPDVSSPFRRFDPAIVMVLYTKVVFISDLNQRFITTTLNPSIFWKVHNGFGQSSLPFFRERITVFAFHDTAQRAYILMIELVRLSVSVAALKSFVT